MLLLALGLVVGAEPRDSRHFPTSTGHGHEKSATRTTNTMQHNMPVAVETHAQPQPLGETAAGLVPAAR